MDPKFEPVFGASVLAYFPRTQKTSHGAWCWRTTFELIFGIAQSGRGRPFLRNMQRELQSVASYAALNVFVSNNQVETCCILTKRSANSGYTLRSQVDSIGYVGYVGSDKQVCASTLTSCFWDHAGSNVKMCMIFLPNSILTDRM